MNKQHHNLMRSIHTFLRLGMSVGLIIVSISTLHSQTLTVIVNSKVNISSLDASTLKAILKGETQHWDDGSKIALGLAQSSSPIGAATAQKVCNMEAAALNKCWIALVFQGKATAPKTFPTDQALKEFVASTPGAIGVVGSEVPLDSSVKQVPVDGKKSF